MKVLYPTGRIATASILVLFSAGALAESPFARPGPDAAMVAGTPGKPANGIYPVSVVEINGLNIPGREAFWLEPGKYVPRVQSRTTNSRGLNSISGRIQEDPDRNLIELVVEGGKSYHIGARVDRSNRRQPCTSVVDRVEDQE